LQSRVAGSGLFEKVKHSQKIKRPKLNVGQECDLIPDKEQALEIHSKVGSSEKIIDHCVAVSKIAELLARRFKQKGIAVDEKSVVAAALLHDIGRNRTQTIKHGFEGANIVKEYSVDESVARIIRRHVGAGISAEEARENGFPEDQVYVPETIEDKIVCFADKVVGPRGELVPFDLEIEKFRRKGLMADRLVNLKVSLQNSLGEDPEEALRQMMKESDG
jgi:uncharacterized protein (TIGR00295 family)